MRLTREQLYEQIWAEPARTVATRYGVSGSFLARMCARLNVLRPPPGYWAQRAVGEEPDRPPLPDVRPGDPVVWTRDEAIPGAYPRPPGTTKAAPRDRSFLRKCADGSHPLVEGVKETFADARASEVGHLRPRTGMLVDIFVSRETLPRALRVAGTIFGKLEERGWPVVLAPRDERYSRPYVDHRAIPRDVERSSMDQWSPRRPTVVMIDGFMIGLSLYELSEYVPVRYNAGHWVRATPAPSRRGLARDQERAEGIYRSDLTSGKLCLRAYNAYPYGDWQREWRESDAGDLVPRASAIGDVLVAAIPEIRERIAQSKKAVEERDRRWEASARARQREAAEQRQAEAREESLKDLLAIVDAWTMARRIEEFFTAAEARIAELDGDELVHMNERLALAREMIAGSDVLRHLREWSPP